MIRSKITFLLPIVVSVFTATINSCTNKSNSYTDGKGGREWEENLISNADVDKISIFNEEKTPTFGLFSDLFSDVEYVELETTAGSIVGVISKLEIQNDGRLLIYDNVNGTVYQFAPDGKFLRSIGQKGKGHEEYMAPEEMVYDPYNDRIIIWDYSKKTLQYYDTEGEMTSSVKLPWVIATFDVVDKDHICVYMNNGEDLEKQKIGYNYKILDHSGNIIHEFAPYGKELGEFMPASKGTLWHIDSITYAKQPYSSLVCQISADTIVPLMYMDFGKYAIPQSLIKGRSWDFHKKIKDNPELIYSLKPYVIDSLMYFNTIRNGIVDIMVTDLKSEETLYFNRMINDVHGLVSNNVIQALSGNRLYFAIEADSFTPYKELLSANHIGSDIAPTLAKQIEDNIPSFPLLSDEYVEKLKSLSKKYNSSSIPFEKKDWDFISRIDEAQNPIIQICTLKK